MLLFSLQAHTKATDTNTHTHTHTHKHTHTNTRHTATHTSTPSETDTSHTHAQCVVVVVYLLQGVTAPYLDFHLKKLSGLKISRTRRLQCSAQSLSHIVHRLHTCLDIFPPSLFEIRRLKNFPKLVFVLCPTVGKGDQEKRGRISTCIEFRVQSHMLR